MKRGFILAGHITELAAMGIVVFLIGMPGCGSSKPSSSQSGTNSSKQDKDAGKRVAKSSQPASTSIDTASSEDAHAEKPVDVPAKNVPPLQQVFRPKDDRPVRNDRMLTEMGIRQYESQRLKLYTDIDPAIAATLPPLIDQAYQAMMDYFGPLAPSRDGTEFQMTGYLIKDDALFREAGLIPGDLPPFDHGRHRRNEFWMREQKYDYYRRHLLIHEVTHCFMTVLPDTDAPVWYMEGMAECFGTHRLQPDGKAQFRVMPTSPEEFGGSGRITTVRNEYAAQKARTVIEILDLTPVEFLKAEHYAWAWALSAFLDTHPRYQARFRQMGGYLQRNAFPTQFIRVFGPDSRDLATEWTLFIHNLQYGYDIRRAAIDFLPGTELTDRRPRHQFEIQSNRGWQSSHVLVQKGQRYDITAMGRFELADQPKPWISEPQGISFRYFNGVPLGLLLGCIRTEAGETGGAADSMLKVYAIGREGNFTAPVSGTLYLRLNDEWNSLHDNHGGVTIEVRRNDTTAG